MLPSATMAVKRHQVIATLAVVGTVVWTTLMTGTAVKLDARMQEIVAVLPLYLVMLFGCYALYSIGIALVTFGDCDAASVELAKVRADASWTAGSVWSLAQGCVT